MSENPDHLTSRRRLFASACAGIALFGIVLALLGTLFGFPEMRTRLHLDLALQGDLFLLLYLGVFIASVIAGPLIDYAGNKLVLSVSSFLVATGLAQFAMAHSFASAAVAALVLGAGGGGLNTSTNVLVSDLYVESRGAMLNLLATFFGVGALLMPLLAAAISGTAPLPQLMLLAAVLAALCGVMYALLDFPRPKEVHSFALSDVAQVARYPGVMLLALLLFFESGNEASMGWASTWTLGLGASARTAALVLALFQAGMMAGRILSTRLLLWIGKPQMILGSAAAAVAGTLIMLAANSVAVLALGVTLTGLALAAVYPTTLALAGDRYQRFAGTVFGVLFAVGLGGGMSFPWVIGHASQRFGLRTGMVMPLAGACMVGVIITAVLRSDRKRALDAAQTSEAVR